ncbi:(D)-galactarate dehydrogenase [uncultured Alphaproteobacteria bacterium]|uniref:Galactarate dehydratase n=1 Tax=uncultured Alphaproteobacteria bacterium TaxID=91750 RepID=A0A212JYQ8_9PROT|nr:(D)-galactarate dehydrogenase [uncultured Alphaproteobacteria bacterium]
MSAVATIVVHPADTVAVVVSPSGGRAGQTLADGTALRENVPMGHKVALRDHREGEAIVRYGEVIGHAAAPIAKGAWVSEALVRMPPAPDLETMPRTRRPMPPQEPLEGQTFEGFRNPDGSVGVKNVLAISMSVQCVAGVAAHVVERMKRELLPRFPNVDDVVALDHIYGCGVAIDAPGAQVPIRTLRNLARNPNFGGETLIVGLGCEKLVPEMLRTQGAAATVVRLQDDAFDGFGAMVEGVMAAALPLLERLNARRRETCPVSDLVVGVQCGGSDALSGLTANPAVGLAADRIVRAGGTVVFSEVTEVRDAIHLLVERAADDAVAEALIREMAWYDAYLARNGADRSANTTPGNKSGGLANIVEKALGSVVKSGSAPIVDVLAPGERVRRKGMVFAATPASDFVCGTQQLASGIALQVFTTGRGTPYGLAAAPVIKVATNSNLATRWRDLVDLDAGRIATGAASLEEVGDELYRLILDVASGRRTVAADRLGLHNALALFNPGPVT